MTHTPGPWNFARAVKPGANEENNHLIYNGEKRHIAEVFQYQEHDFIIELAEASANARLIAAAPELLEALKKAKGAIITLEINALGWSYTDDKQRYSLRDELLSNISKAIDNAEGSE